MEGGEIVFTAITTTVMLSIVLHGISAGPASRWYAQWLAGFGTCEEMKPVSTEPFEANLFESEKS